jgi:hypothetical protein
LTNSPLASWVRSSSRFSSLAISSRKCILIRQYEIGGLPLCSHYTWCIPQLYLMNILIIMHYNNSFSHLLSLW